MNVDTAMPPMAEHLVNLDGDVLILTPVLPSPPVAFRVSMIGGTVSLGMAGLPSEIYAVPKSSIDLLRASRRMLVLEIGETTPVREGWIPMID